MPDGVSYDQATPVDGIIQLYDKRSDGTEYLSIEKQYQNGEPNGWVTYYGENGLIEVRYIYIGNYLWLTFPYSNGQPIDSESILQRQSVKNIMQRYNIDDFYDLD